MMPFCEKNDHNVNLTTCFLSEYNFHFFLIIEDKSLKLKQERTVSKTGVGATLPGVQIPLSPPLFNQLLASLSTTLVTVAFFAH